MSENREAGGETATAEFLYTFPNQAVYDGMSVEASIFPKESMDKAREFQFREGDIVVAGYPKSGTTWVQEMVWLINNEADTEGASKELLEKRVPFMEYWLGPNHPYTAEILATVPGPRLVVSHLPFRHYEPEINKGKVKFVYVIRNPKDALVSFFKFYQIVVALGPYPGSWDDFFELFKAGHLLWGDYFDQVLPYWAQRSRPNILFVHYEDLKLDLSAGIVKMAEFCGKSLTPDQVTKIAQHCTFDKMKDNPMVNKADVFDRFTSKSKFMRKGIVGDWKNYFTVAQNEYFDELFKEKMKESGLDIKFEI